MMRPRADLPATRAPAPGPARSGYAAAAGGISGSVMASITAGPPAASASSHAGPTASGVVDTDALQTEHLGVPGVREVRQVLGDLELRITGHDALLPRDLVEVVVVEHEHHELGIGPAIPIVGEIDQRQVAEHLHRAVANRRDHRAIGVGELGRERIGNGRAHRRQGARERGLHAAAHPQVARPPVGRRARVAGEDGSIGKPAAELVKQQLGVERVSRLVCLRVENLPPARHVAVDLVAASHGPPCASGAG